MEYLNMVMGISTYLFAVTIIAAFRRGGARERDAPCSSISLIFFFIL